MYEVLVFVVRQGWVFNRYKNIFLTINFKVHCKQEFIGIRRFAFLIPKFSKDGLVSVRPVKKVPKKYQIPENFSGFHL